MTDQSAFYDPAWLQLTPYEKLSLVFEVATIYVARQSGVDRSVLEAQGPPSVQSLDADPVVIEWRDGTKFELPAATLAAGVAIRLRQRARRRVN